MSGMIFGYEMQNYKYFRKKCNRQPDPNVDSALKKR